MSAERKCQVMFPSYLSQDVTVVVRFRYVSVTDFLIVKVTEENIEESYTLPAIEHHDNGRAPTIM